tara:strand:+ start:101 stop:490 length:390 start_codon:yes stop_codon:yes gene_type:complete
MPYKILISIILFCSSLFCESKDIMFESIETYLSKYRYIIKQSDFQTQNGILQLEITSRRTNIKSQTLLGFYSIGRSLTKTSAIFREAQIIVHYDSYNNQQEIIIAPIDFVKKLSSGQISSRQFFNEIGF